MEASPQEVKAFPAGNLYKLCPKLFSCFFAPSVLSYTSRWNAPKSKAAPKTQITSCYRMFIRRCVGMVDEEDSKSFGSDTVWVRVPPPAPQKRRMQLASSFFVMWWDSNPFQCKMPVAFCSNQFKNWLQRSFLRSKKAIESHHRRWLFCTVPLKIFFFQHLGVSRAVLDAPGDPA